MASSSAPLISDTPPTYNEATGGVNQAAGAVGGYGTTNYVQQPGQTGGIKSPPAGAYTGGYQTGPAGQVYQAPPGYMPAGAVPAGQQPTYMQPGTTVVMQPQPSVVVVGGCPACRIGVLEDDFTCLGVCCAIFFFPLGILCCLAMRQRRCPNCGAVFG